MYLAVYSTGTNYRGQRGGRAPDCFAYVFASLGIIIICRSYKLILSHQVQVTYTLTLRLLISYIYGAPSKARNANVVYIYIYIYMDLRLATLKQSLSICCTMFQH